MTVITDGIVDSPLNLVWSVATAKLRGESKSGDFHLVRTFADEVLIAAIDGLGHGDEAAIAAETAVAALSDKPQNTLIDHFTHCHERLLKSRGVVMNLASFNRNGTLTWGGVGNILGVLIRADLTQSPRYEHLLVQAGVVGYQLPVVRSSVQRVGPGDTLIFTTDGIRREFSDRFTLDRIMGMKTSQSNSIEVRNIADRILGQYATGKDDALVVVARYLGTPK